YNEACRGNDRDVANEIVGKIARHRADKRPRLVQASLRALGLAGFDRAGDLLMTGGPERMLLAAVLIGIAFSRNLFPCGALALFERIGMRCHRCHPKTRPPCTDVIVSLRSSGCLSNRRRKSFRRGT